MTEQERMRAVYAASMALYRAEMAPLEVEDSNLLGWPSELRAKRTVRELMRWRTIMAEIVADEERTS